MLLCLLLAACFSQGDTGGTPAPADPCAELAAQAGTSATAARDAGTCYLQQGQTPTALEQFVRGLEQSPGDSTLNILAGFTDLQLVVDDIYCALYDASLEQGASFAGFQQRLIELFLSADASGRPLPGGRLETLAQRARLEGVSPLPEAPTAAELFR